MSMLKDYLDGAATYAGTRIVSSPGCFKRVDDWKRVRSPSRAARRIASGKRKHPVPQRMAPITFISDGVLYAHPTIYARLMLELHAEHQQTERKPNYGPIITEYRAS